MFEISIDSNISTTIVAINTITTTIVIIVDDIIPISCSTIDRFYGRSWDAVSIFFFSSNIMTTDIINIAITGRGIILMTIILIKYIIIVLFYW